MAQAPQKLSYELESKKRMTGFFPDTDNEMHAIIAPSGEVINKTNYNRLPKNMRPGGIALNKKQFDSFVNAVANGADTDAYSFFGIPNPYAQQKMTTLNAGQQKDPYSGTFNSTSGEVYGGAPRPGEAGDKIRLDQSQVDDYGNQVQRAWDVGFDNTAVNPWSLFKSK